MNVEKAAVLAKSAEMDSEGRSEGLFKIEADTTGGFVPVATPTVPTGISELAAADGDCDA